MAYGLVARFAVLFVASVVVGPSSAAAEARDSVPAARQFLVFQCGNAICRVGADGKGLRRLTSPKLGESLDEDPVWSPDGRRIAFTRFNLAGDESTRLYIMNSDGTRQRRLSDRYDVRWPSWSPDGTRIAFYWDPATERDDEGIYVIRQDGHGVAKLVGGGKPWSLDGRGSWSPDGRKFVYSFQGHLYVVGSDGSGRRRLTSSSYDAWPAWSPDGKHLAFVRQKTAALGEPSFISVAAPDGTRPRRVASTTGFAWSPDSSKIAFWGDDGLRVASIAGGRQRRVAPDIPGSSGHSWSPDGNLIAFDVMGEPEEDPEFYIYLARADGTKHWRLVSGQHPDWSPLLRR